jgi:hypothetical protein
MHQGSARRLGVVLVMVAIGCAAAFLVDRVLSPEHGPFGLFLRGSTDYWLSLLGLGGTLGALSALAGLRWQEAHGSAGEQSSP